jgi:hypothetical protein
MKINPISSCTAILCLFLPMLLSAQLFRPAGIVDGAAQIKLVLSLGKQRTTFYNLSGSIGISRTFQNGDFRFIPGAQLTVNMYSKGLGTSIIDRDNRSGQLDVVTSAYFLTGTETGRNIRPKYIRLFNQFSANAIQHTLDYGFSYGTSFIINNHQRNQQIGHMGFNVDQILIGYYNDGFWPFKKYAGDAFDRYWTGGGYLAVGLNTYGRGTPNQWHSEQFMEYAYDRFTGNVQRAYRLSKELILSGIPQKEVDQIFLNRAFSSISLRNLNGSHVGMAMFGQCPKCDVQDGLHRLLGYSRHLSFSTCTFVVHGSYQYNQPFTLQNP